MRKHLIGALILMVSLVATTASLAAGYGYGKQTVIRAGNVIIKTTGEISPSTLPRAKFAPISASTSGSVEAADGGHPPAAESVVVNVDKTFAINTEGLPVCREGRIEAQSNAQAMRACGSAIVGRGSAEAEVAFPESKPFRASGPLVFFNGGTRGGTTLLLAHLYAAVPVPTAIVTPIAITKTRAGRYGLHAVAEVPVIAGGSGSVTKINFVIGRKIQRRGEQRGYVEAKCPTGTYFTEVQAAFRDGPSLKGTLALPCTPKA